MGLEVIRTLLAAAQTQGVEVVTVRVKQSVAHFLNNQKRKELSRIEEEGSLTVRIHGSENVFPEFFEIECLDSRGNPIHVKTAPALV